MCVVYARSLIPAVWAPAFVSFGVGMTAPAPPHVHWLRPCEGVKTAAPDTSVLRTLFGIWLFLMRLISSTRGDTLPYACGFGVIATENSLLSTPDCESRPISNPLPLACE